MTNALLVVLGLLVILTVSLQRTYSKVPLKELKKRARSGDRIAESLSLVAAYTHSLRAVLWFLIGLSTAGFLVILAGSAPLWFALTASAVLLWLAFVWLPAARVSFVSEKIAAIIAPVLAKVVSALHPFINWLHRTIRRNRQVTVHTGLYDRFDLIDLLERQQVQADNQIEQAELEIAKHALTFGDLSIGECMVPRRKVKLVSQEDNLGPVIMDELHASGHTRFPVYEGQQDNIVGTLFLHDLVRAKADGKVKSLMRREAYYLHEDQSLYDALQALLKTHKHLFVVVNKFEEFVGILSSEDIIEAIVGRPIFDDFEQYDNLRAVAAREAHEEHEEHIENEQEAEEPAPEENEPEDSADDLPEALDEEPAAEPADESEDEPIEENNEEPAENKEDNFDDIPDDPNFSKDEQHLQNKK